MRADVLLEVVDAADRHAAEHRLTIRTVLDELGAGHKPRVLVHNKIDVVKGEEGIAFVVPRGEQHAVAVSALTGQDWDDLRAELVAVLTELWVDVDLPCPIPPAPFSPGCASADRSPSITATRMFVFTAGWRRARRRASRGRPGVAACQGDQPGARRAPVAAVCRRRAGYLDRLADTRATHREVHHGRSGTPDHRQDRRETGGVPGQGQQGGEGEGPRTRRQEGRLRLLRPRESGQIAKLLGSGLRPSASVQFDRSRRGIPCAGPRGREAGRAA